MAVSDAREDEIPPYRNAVAPHRRRNAERRAARVPQLVTPQASRHGLLGKCCTEISPCRLGRSPTPPIGGCQNGRTTTGAQATGVEVRHHPQHQPQAGSGGSDGRLPQNPVLQVGADIYCDTALICDVLEHIQPEPVLYPPHLKGVSRVFAQWADSTLFWASWLHNLQPKGAEMLFASLPPAAAQAFAEDRKAMSAGMVRQRPQDATAAYRSYLRRIAHMVEEHDFLFGTEPCVADFAAYHPLWFTRRVVPLMDSI